MRVRGKISWYGGPHDAQDNNQTSTGIPNASVAGIATRYAQTKGGWWYLHEPGRPGQLVRDIETGPATSTGRQFDLNPRAAAKFGWKANDASFPTDKTLEGVYLGKDFHRAAMQANRLKGGGARRRTAMPQIVAPAITSGDTFGAAPVSARTNIASLAAVAQLLRQLGR